MSNQGQYCIFEGENVIPDSCKIGNFCQLKDVKLGENVVIHGFCNLYGCEIGDNTIIANFVEIQRGAKIGKDCRIQSHTFICNGVELGNSVFFGFGSMFCNDKLPVAGNPRWKMEKTIVEDNVSIGNGVTITPGITIGRGSLIGAGSTVACDVPEGEVWVGPRAQFYRDV